MGRSPPSSPMWSAPHAHGIPVLEGKGYRTVRPPAADKGFACPILCLKMLSLKAFFHLLPIALVLSQVFGTWCVFHVIPSSGQENVFLGMEELGGLEWALTYKATMILSVSVENDWLSGWLSLTQRGPKRTQNVGEKSLFSNSRRIK